MCKVSDLANCRLSLMDDPPFADELISLLGEYQRSGEIKQRHFAVMELDALLNPDSTDKLPFSIRPIRRA